MGISRPSTDSGSDSQTEGSILSYTIPAYDSHLQHRTTADRVLVGMGLRSFQYQDYGPTLGQQNQVIGNGKLVYSLFVPFFILFHVLVYLTVELLLAPPFYCSSILLFLRSCLSYM